MESKSDFHTFSAFQIYSTERGSEKEINVMVDKLWIKDNRVFFRVVEGIPQNTRIFKKEQEKGFYSIKKEELLCIRCRLYIK